MKQRCKYDSARDILAVQPGLAVNLPDAMDFGRIQDTSVHSQYNGQKEITEVGTRVAEPFDVIEFERSYTRLRKYIKDDQAKDKDKE